MAKFYRGLKGLFLILFALLVGCERQGNVLSIAFSHHNSDIVYIGGAGGRFYKSTDGGNVFTRYETGTTYNIAAITVNPSLSSVIYAGSYGDSVYRSVDSGLTWTITSRGLDDNVGTQAVNAVVVDPKESRRVYIGTNHGVYVTHDGGSQWSSINTGMANRFVIALALHPKNREILIAGTNEGLFITTNGARQWSRAPQTSRDWAVNTVQFDPVHPDTIYVGTNLGIFKSVDLGQTWEARNTGLSRPFIVSIAIDREDSTRLYAGGDGVYQSQDAGATWHLLANAPESVLMVSLYPKKPGVLFAGTMTGLYKSTDFGANWMHLKLK